MTRFSKQQKVMDLIFGVQVILGIILGVSQFIKMLSSTQGVSTSNYLFSWIFLLVNLFLAFRARKEKTGRILWQMIFNLVEGSIVYTSFLVLLIFKAENLWDNKDWLTTLLVVASLLGTIFVSQKIFKVSLKDPFVQGFISLFAKTIPQLIMAYKIFMVGGAGLSIVMIFVFHAITLSRFLQNYLIIKEAGWDKNRKAIMLSEVGNEVSWGFITLAWFFS